MPKPIQTPEQRSLRLRGYELYLSPDEGGRRRSFRSIAMALGVTLGTVLYWRNKDKWEDRVQTALQAQTASAGAAGQALAALLRTSLFEHVGTLNSMIRDKTEKPSIRLAAIRELADIVLKLKAIDPTELVPSKPKSDLSFKDDLHGPSQQHAQPGTDNGLQPGTNPPDNHDDEPTARPAVADWPNGATGESGSPGESSVDSGWGPVSPGVLGVPDVGPAAASDR